MNNKSDSLSSYWDVVLIGTSAGGMKALEYLIPNLPTPYPTPIIITQHHGPSTDNYLVTHLDKISNLTVKEAEDLESIQPGVVYLAPGGYHLLVEENLTFSLCVSEKVSYARPSIDVLFISACDVYKGRVLAIVLTGANEDGKKGALFIKAHGGTVIAEDPHTAEVPFMPQAVILSGAADFILSLEEIKEFLTIHHQHKPRHETL